MKKGKVYVGSMNMRGKWARPLDENTTKINVTSAQGKQAPNRLTFSPMTPIEGGYKSYWNFESYWQSGKVYEDININVTKKWWREQKQPKRRYPNSKGKKVLYAVFDGNDERMDYITSRKKVYIPEYYNLIKDTILIKKYQEQYKNGISFTVYDFDGPRLEDGTVNCLQVNKKNLKEKLYETSYPFGHGYIVAAAICGIDILSL